MSCQDCSGSSLRAERLQRECDRLRLDLREAESENRGLLAQVTRLRSEVLSMASQVTRTP